LEYEKENTCCSTKLRIIKIYKKNKNKPKESKLRIQGKMLTKNVIIRFGA
jgi:hypothetical protein